MRNGEQPVMPQQVMEEDKEEGHILPVTCIGLTKREWFAGLAMQGEIAASANNITKPNTEALATYSVECADALLAALEDTGGDQ